MDVREPILAYGKKRLTEEEYLTWENSAQRKHEFFEGQVFAMAECSYRHNIIFSNVFGNVGHFLKGMYCQPYGGNMLIHVPQNTFYTYPDISIICGSILDSYTKTVYQPIVIIEILSAATRDYDRGSKFQYYRGIPALKEYVLIDSEAIHVEVFRINNSGRWELEEYNTLDSILQIKQVNCSLSLHDVYERTQLTDHNQGNITS